MADAPRPRSRERLLGRTITRLVASAPAAWPLLRGPVRRFFDQRARGWDERTGAGSPEHLAALAAATAALDLSPERILDLGTGTGEGALFLAREYPAASVRGIDLSEEMIRLAQRKVGLDPEGRVAFRVADAAALPYDDDSFDLVASVNLPPYFAETARVLRRGGAVVVVASGGQATPFYTPPDALREGFANHGIGEGGRGEALAGIWWAGRRQTG